MVKFDSFVLKNGLKVYVHNDPTVSITALNLLYKVGSRNESESKTGFAHLFEHLMFGGSKNIANYDEPLQRVGGENNAFTTTDYTNYYLTIPTTNLESGFWLESDRMLSLSFDPKVLEVQRKVVIEEFKQRYINQPYGEVWHEIRKLAYETHPYKWPVIGKNLSHIEEAEMEDVKEFFLRFYNPSNAVLTVAGNVETSVVKELAEKWFGPIEGNTNLITSILTEPVQTTKKSFHKEADVPQNAIYMAFRMGGKFDEDYYAQDLLSDILGHGKSSRLYSSLVQEKNIFNILSCYVLGTIDPGLLLIQGMISDGITYEQAENEIWEVLSKIKNEGVTDRELNKVKNRAVSSLEFSQIEVLERAMAISFGAAFDKPNLINEEIDFIQTVSIEDVNKQANTLLNPENVSVLYYGK